MHVAVVKVKNSIIMWLSFMNKTTFTLNTLGHLIIIVLQAIILEEETETQRCDLPKVISR